MRKVIRNTIIFLLLSICTQVGGILFLAYLIIIRLIFKYIVSKAFIFFIRLVGFPLLYFLFTLLIIPNVASFFGRFPLPISPASTFSIQPAHSFYWLANRHYVKKELLAILQASSTQLQQTYPDMVLTYMDAGFPFWDLFPMWPHLSHADGNKVDLAFIYWDKAEKKSIYKAGSLLGYGLYETPKHGEVNYPAICEKKGYRYYNIISKWFPVKVAKTIELDQARTKSFISVLSHHPKTGKIFIEPHLKTRLGLGQNSKVRFHGCQAIRHDDHIHLQAL